MASGGDKLIYFLAGGFVGASVALLFAPKSGTETREFLENKYRESGEHLMSKAREGKTKVAEKSLEVTERIGESIGRGREILQKQKDQVTAAIDAGRQAYEEQKRKSESKPGRKAAGGKN